MLQLGGRDFPQDYLIMAIVNRTPDSFYDKGETFEFEVALRRVRDVVREGAEIVDIGGVRAAPGAVVSVEEETERTAPLVAAVRAEFPDLIISVDTWRHEVGDAACRAGADILNDAWGGWDPELAEVAGQHGVGLICTHAGGVVPRTRPHRIEYADIVGDVLERTVALAERAVGVGVSSDSVLIDPGHDFGKNTRHSLEITRRLADMVATGWPVLVSLSNKDFIGESLGRPVDQRLVGTLATTSVCAWLGARVFRAHNVPETRQTLDMVATIRGSRAPVRTVRGRDHLALRRFGPTAYGGARHVNPRGRVTAKKCSTRRVELRCRTKWIIRILRRVEPASRREIGRRWTGFRYRPTVSWP